MAEKAMAAYNKKKLPITYRVTSSYYFTTLKGRTSVRYYYGNVELSFVNLSNGDYPSPPLFSLRNLRKILYYNTSRVIFVTVSHF